MSELIFAIAGYLLGSIPFGLLLTRAAGLGDVRNIGSGNIGATNVLRTGNKKIAALTLLCDGLKGFFPVLAAKYWGGGYAELAAGFGALAGHIFPVWLGFKGGKGVATGLGALFGWSWILGLVFIASWIGTFLALRISSASALTAVLIVTIIAATGVADSADGIFRLVWPAALLAVVIWIMHRANIARLLKGQEPKSSFSKKP
ncbi:MAG: glycerol-3-phosphate 1-O-acyltransferase PlsY [Proteobacteria bacterium]|nr:glycerol-3-phosphate 1-O-acyltransferase PlsY [Pseudomonadota bacterium]